MHAVRPGVPDRPPQSCLQSRTARPLLYQTHDWPSPLARRPDGDTFNPPEPRHSVGLGMVKGVHNLMEWNRIPVPPPPQNTSPPLRWQRMLQAPGDVEHGHGLQWLQVQWRMVNPGTWT